MNKVRIVLALLVVALVASPVLAQGTVKHLSGNHYQFNIIGSPKGISGDTSNGRTIMVPLKTNVGSDVPALTCDADPYTIVNDTTPKWVNQEPTGAKIYFQPTTTGTFEILDRDATDADGATVQVPVDASSGNYITFDIYVRILGKPNTCMKIDAYAVDTQNGTEYYFWAGSVQLNRKTGQSAWVKVNYLFDVNYCQVDPATNKCVADTSQELSVFNNIFESYFWNLQNNGTRLVQVRMYPH